jgi:hypothetical protein
MISAFFFIGFSFLGRIFYPFGDEPDFTIRAPRVLNGDHPFWSPYSLFHDVLENISVISECKIDAGRVAILGHVDFMSCLESFDQILIRLSIIILVISPLLMAVVFRKWFLAMSLFLPINLSKQEWNHRLDVMSLTLIFTGMIYYLGIFAEEQFTLVLSLWIFLFWGSAPLVLLLLIMIMIIDIGNSLVIFNFTLFSMFFLYIVRKYNLKQGLFYMLATLIFAYLIGFYLLTYMEQISFLAAKAEAMAALAEKGDFANKYPVILRPIITFMTAVFMTPAGLKVMPLYIVFMGLFIGMIFKIKRFYRASFRKKTTKLKLIDTRVTLYATAITTILFFVFLFPNYGNVKYYIFLLPFILSAALLVYSKRNMFKLFIASNMVVFINLILYRL